LSDKFRDQIIGGAADLTDGASQVSAGIDKLAAKLDTSFAQIKTNADAYGSAYTSTITQAGQVETITNTPITAAGGATVNQMLAQISKSAANTDLQVNPKTDLTGKDLTKEANVTGLLTKYMTAYTTVVTMKAQSSTAFSSVDAILSSASSGSITSINQVYQSEIGLLLAAVSKGGVYTALSQVYSTAMNTTDPDTGMTLTQSLSALSEGAKKVSEGAATLKAGIGSFDDLKPASETVCSALYKLKIGSLAVTAGTSSLNDGLGKLNSNSSTLNQGITQLADGSATLAGGSAQIKDGTSQLNNAAVSLGDGVSALNEGAITLKDGMVEFNDTGIKKITALLGNDTDNALDTIKQVIQLGNDYQSFAGKSDGVEGTVKFIYKTEGINQD
jgi:putative membrane protein